MSRSNSEKIKNNKKEIRVTYCFQLCNRTYSGNYSYDEFMDNCYKYLQYHYYFLPNELLFSRARSLWAKALNAQIGSAKRQLIDKEESPLTKQPIQRKKQKQNNKISLLYHSHTLPKLVSLDFSNNDNVGDDNDLPPGEFGHPGISSSQIKSSNSSNLIMDSINTKSQNSYTNIIYDGDDNYNNTIEQIITTDSESDTTTITQQKRHQSSPFSPLFSFTTNLQNDYKIPSELFYSQQKSISSLLSKFELTPSSSSSSSSSYNYCESNKKSTKKSLFSSKLIGLFVPDNDKNNGYKKPDTISLVDNKNNDGDDDMIIELSPQQPKLTTTIEKVSTTTSEDSSYSFYSQEL